MKSSPKKRPLPEYVLCYGPFRHEDGTTGVYFRVKVHPQQLLGDRIVKFPISGSTPYEGYYPHELAWAAGYKIIDHFIGGILPDAVIAGTKLCGIEAAAHELADTISRAPGITEIYQVATCPKCSQPVEASQTPLRQGQPPPFSEGDFISLSCHCGHQFQGFGKELFFLVRFLGSTLERALREA